ncbi:polycystin-1-like protein 3 [Ptychodera flava]|uniref:polycystin-1-like protein 3 n=1 Tax=Ptychodera flava TaxID=63121 RepID=UPI00396A32E2
MIGTDAPPAEEQMSIPGIYLDVQNVTYFGFAIQIHQLFHAVIIWAENSQAVFGNTTAYVFNKRPNCTNTCPGYQFSVVVTFHGDYSTIFIPEHYFLRPGEYYVTFTIQKYDDITLLVSVKRAMCSYLSNQHETWRSDGCQVSPASNITSTLCLCNHLTAFTQTLISGEISSHASV